MTIEYDYTVEKINKDGDIVLSNKLEKGEKLTNGQTYKNEQERLGKEPESSPFAQGSMTEHNNPENPSEGLTLSEDGVNTKRVGDVDPAEPARAELDPELVATDSSDGNSTVIVEADKNNQATEEAVEEVESGSSDKEYVDPPKESDSKQEWYDYATEHKGLTAEYDDITKNEIIAFVGEQS